MARHVGREACWRWQPGREKDGMEKGQKGVKETNQGSAKKKAQGGEEEEVQDQH
jgi:hypothetical protein